MYLERKFVNACGIELLSASTMCCNLNTTLIGKQRKKMKTTLKRHSNLISHLKTVFIISNFPWEEKRLNDCYQHFIFFFEREKQWILHFRRKHACFDIDLTYLFSNYDVRHYYFFFKFYLLDIVPLFDSSLFLVYFF